MVFFSHKNRYRLYVYHKYQFPENIDLKKKSLPNVKVHYARVNQQGSFQSVKPFVRHFPVSETVDVTHKRYISGMVRGFFFKN